MTKDIGKIILNKIKEKHISPKPRWRFLLQDYVVWMAFVISIVVGALSFAISIHLIRDGDWDIYRLISDSKLLFIVDNIPYIWLFVFTIFLVVAFYNFRHTKSGYKYKFNMLVTACVLISFVFGGGLYAMGAGERVERFIVERLPVYEKMKIERMKRWSNPQRGVMFGEMIELTSEQKIKIRDFNNKVWSVDKEKIRMKPGAEMHRGAMLKVLGEDMGDGRFRARELHSLWLKNNSLKKVK